MRAAGASANCWTRRATGATILFRRAGRPDRADRGAGRAVFLPEQAARAPRLSYTRGPMIAVIGNVIAGLGVVSLFTATLRLTRPAR
mgnify:CR=1 FL=1